MEEFIDREDLGEDAPLKRSEEGIILVPEELKGAPDDVKDLYIKWLEIGESIKNSKSRYFSFVSERGSDEMVDAMNLQGKSMKIAKAKGISDSDLERLKRVCKEMEELKHQKSRLKRKWMHWLRPRLGKDVLDWRKSEIVDLYAKYSNHDEVKKYLENLGYAVNITSVMKFFMNNKDIIDKKRLEFIRSSKDHYLATDAGRMETLAMLHSKFMNMFTEMYLKPNPPKEELRAISRELRAILEQARKEIKGEEVRLTIDGKIDINASLQASLTIQEATRKIPVSMISIFLVAAKRGIDPTKIIASLVNSYYKEFNGFGKLSSASNPPHTMDLIRNYDWNEIAMYHANKPEDEVGTIEAYEVVPFREAAVIQSKRDQLKQLIQDSLTKGENQ